MKPIAGNIDAVISAGAPLAEARAVAVMVHGRNAAPANILALVPRLDRSAFAYLAPAAPKGAWYPYSFLSEIAKNEPDLTSALETIGRVVGDVIDRGIPRERIVLLGFSQGACLSAEFAARNAGRYGGLIIFSGGLIGPPGTPRNYPGSLEETPVFPGCSDVDAHVPRERVGETAAVLGRMGAEVTERIYPGMGHLVNDDEIAAAQIVMDNACPWRR